MFKKEDIKNGMVVEFNDGKRRLAWENRLIDETGFISMNYISKELYNIDDNSGERIDKVYLTHEVGYFRDFLRDDSLTCIWSRYKD